MQSKLSAAKFSSNVCFAQSCENTDAHSLSRKSIARKLHWHRRHFTVAFFPVSIHLALTFFILRKVSAGTGDFAMRERQWITEG